MNVHVIEPLAVSEEKMQQMTETLEKNGHAIRFFSDRNEDTEEIVKRCRGAEVVIIGNLPFPTAVVEQLEELKLLNVAFTGLDHVAMDACRSRGITVCNASGYSTINVAELTVGLMIDLSRNITKLDPITRKGGTKSGYVGNDLAGKTIGLVGLGSIGQYVARLLSGWGCRILSPDRGKPVPPGLAVELSDWDTLMRESDIISLHCPLNEFTKGLIGYDEFAKMKNSGFLINCARGPVVDDEALIDALQTGQIAGAALDVFAWEPPLDSKKAPVLELKNVIVTPHIAFATEEAFLRRADIVVDNFLSWAAGTPKNVKA